jgi:hypothetical protein
MARKSETSIEKADLSQDLRPNVAGPPREYSLTAELHQQPQSTANVN